MLYAVYKSSRKDETYLYLAKKDDFSSVPEPLLATFGKPIFVMLLPLMKVDKLAQVDKQKLIDEVQEKGFYLQIPPPKENLLKAHLSAQNSEK
ncbi:YcgL domain-containing protein [Aestuariibacter sp. AA17]|uniref:YcgL domain-containing protein OE749_10395 n=1 Tax=Fluctibacter corallii TaxID=2984329 RepID=A0ABT3A8U0_9ALTE|nr:YcgL domain-containing protein [Aestuariibacter sp. AA17]MCV2885100.1 YcgL domain-containing protein [Aestuariibacter sp. AA17]